MCCIVSRILFRQKKIGKVLDLKMTCIYFISYLPLLAIFIISTFLFSDRYTAFVFSLFTMGIYSHVNLLFILRNEIYIKILEQMKDTFKRSITRICK